MAVGQLSHARDGFVDGLVDLEVLPLQIGAALPAVVEPDEEDPAVVRRAFADQDTTGVYSRSGISGTGTTGSVVKMRLPGSISRATALNSPSPTASQRTDPAKSDVSAAGNAWSMSQDVCPLA